MTPKKDRSEFLASQVIKMFRIDITLAGFKKAEQDGRIPKAKRRTRGTREYRYWQLSDLPAIGKLYGSFKAPNKTIVVSTYVPKGGVGKTAWTFNLSRLLSLHGLRTLVFGFDFQCSLSKSFGIDYDAEELPLSIYDAIVDPNVSLEDIIVSTDIPTLDLVPESDELSMLDRQILSRQRREYILEDMLAPLRNRYDVILIDCPPQWLEMVSNSLYVSDCIVSPVLADGESYHSFKKFMRELQKFMKVMHKNYEYVKFIPNQVDTRAKYTSSFQKKYIQEYPDIFTTSYLRDAIQLKESGTARQSIIEYAPGTTIAEDFFYTALEVWDGILAACQADTVESSSEVIEERV